MPELCNIRTTDGIHWSGREISEEGHYDGPIRALKDGAFERLKASGAIDLQYSAVENWWIGSVPEEDLEE